MDDWSVALAALAEKYRELLALACERDALTAVGVFQLAGNEREARHARTRLVAQRFPGSLRELDGATAHALRGRLDELETELASRRAREAAPRWMRVVDDFHAELRALLALKGAQSRGESLTDADLMRITNPPYGRLQELVWTRLAERHGLSPEELRAIVFGGVG